MKVETINKSQRETTLDIGKLGKKSEVIDASIINRIQEIEESILGAADTIEIVYTSVKENAKCKMLVTQNIQEIQDITKPKDHRYRKEPRFKPKGTVNIFKNIIE